jgi:hypothetical protein
MVATLPAQAGATPRPHTDEELTAALHPFVLDHLARLALDRERHGRDGERQPEHEAELTASRRR